MQWTKGEPVSGRMTKTSDKQKLIYFHGYVFRSQDNLHFIYSFTAGTKYPAVGHDSKLCAAVLASHIRHALFYQVCGSMSNQCDNELE
jgi:hypothetical protein